jgi:hypothetical protein
MIKILKQEMNTFNAENKEFISNQDNFNIKLRELGPRITFSL